jgi:excisionase family DNA binding protein
MLGYADGVVLGAGDGAIPMIGIPDMDQAVEDSVVADLDPKHQPRRPVQDLMAWPGGEDFDVVITALAGYDVRLTYQPNIVRRRAEQLEAALIAVYFTRPGGLTALVATHDLMDNPVPFGRRKLADMADLIGAVRLPAGTYRQTPGTDEVVDVLMFRRRAWHECRRGPDFENAPATYLDGEMVTINTYLGHSCGPGPRPDPVRPDRATTREPDRHRHTRTLRPGAGRCDGLRHRHRAATRANHEAARQRAARPGQRHPLPPGVTAAAAGAPHRHARRSHSPRHVTKPHRSTSRQLVRPSPLEDSMATIANGPASHEQLVSLNAAAERFDVSVKTLRRRISDGTITGYRLGRLIRVDLDEVSDQLLVTIPSVGRSV